MSDSYGVAGWVRQVCLADPTAARLTEENVRSALHGLALQPVKPYDWLTLAIQSAVHFGRELADKQREKSNSQIRDELADLSARAYDLWVDLFDLSDACRETLNGTVPDGEREQFGELYSAGFSRFRQLSGDLEWLALFLRAGSSRAHANVEKPHWEQAQQKRIRIWLARCLAVVFESAYGRKPVVKNGGSNDRPESFGVWPDFLCRVLRAANVESAGANLKEVLDEARRLHRAEKVLFAPGFLPE